MKQKINDVIPYRIISNKFSVDLCPHCLECLAASQQLPAPEAPFQVMPPQGPSAQVFHEVRLLEKNKIK